MIDDVQKHVAQVQKNKAKQKPNKKQKFSDLLGESSSRVDEVMFKEDFLKSIAKIAEQSMMMK